jgi:hypothetical protein
LLEQRLSFARLGVDDHRGGFDLTHMRCNAAMIVSGA